MQKWCRREVLAVKYVKDLLHEMFSEDAIMCAALNEQLDDIRYCTEHSFTDKDYIRVYEAAGHYGDVDGNKTYNRANIMEFRKRAAELIKILKGKKGGSLYDGANEIEHFAIRALYYDSW